MLFDDLFAFVDRQFRILIWSNIVVILYFSQDDLEDTLIVIFIAETDPDYVYQISADVQKQFQKHLGLIKSTVGENLTFVIADTGLIEIISPPGEFYPDMSGLKQTLGMS